jgi:general secretion pathway protein J
MKHAQKGFTLLEALISVTVLGLIGMLTFGTFVRALASKERATEINDHYHEVRQAMVRMSKEISMAFISVHRDCDDPRTETLFKADSAGFGQRLDFTSFSHHKMKLDANESDQNELSYFLKRDEKKGVGLVLMRREASRIDEEPEEGGVERVLAQNVTDLDFTFYDPKNDRWEDSWDTTHSDYRGRLPMFVGIHMKVKGPQGEEESFYTKTRVYLTKALRIVGSGARECVD